MNKLLITTLSLAASCGCPEPGEFDPLHHPPERDAPAEAELAVEIVADFYGVDHDYDVWWSDLADGYPRGVSQLHSNCCWSRVGWDGELAMSETALAHEMGHCALWAEGYGAGHRTDYYGPGGLVEQANEALRAAGL